MTPLGHQLGLVDDHRFGRVRTKEAEIARAAELLTSRRTPDVTLEKLLRRPETEWQHLLAWAPELADVSPAVVEQLTFDIKYSGYVERQEVDIARQQRLQDKRIPADFDFSRLTQLRAEAREKLSRVRPRDLAQASRISGITPVDVALLIIHLGGK